MSAIEPTKVEVAALEHECPICAASANEWCYRDDGNSTNSLHVLRLQKGTPSRSSLRRTAASLPGPAGSMDPELSDSIRLAIIGGLIAIGLWIAAAVAYNPDPFVSQTTFRALRVVAIIASVAAAWGIVRTVLLATRPRRQEEPPPVERPPCD
jgi:hypothetical protein